MAISFYDYDYNIVLSEKRDEQLRGDNDKINGKISNIIIIYSAISFFLIPIVKDCIDKKCSTAYLIAIILFAIIFLISIYYSVLFIYPKQYGTLIPPQYFYTPKKAELEAEIPNKSQSQIDATLKNLYLLDLERSIIYHLTLFRRKQGFYNRGLAFALYSLLPFIVCTGFHLFVDENVPKVKIENIDKIRIFISDTTKPRKTDSCKVRIIKKIKYVKKENNCNAFKHANKNVYYFKADSGATFNVTNNNY